MSVTAISKGTVQKCWNLNCVSNNNATKKCSRCRQAIYCNQTCQKADWPRHKITCAPMATPNTAQPSIQHLVTKTVFSDSKSQFGRNFCLFRADLVKIIEANIEVVCKIFNFPLDFFNSNIEFARRVSEWINQFSPATLNLLIQYPKEAMQVFDSPMGIELVANKLPDTHLALVLRYPIAARRLFRTDFNVDSLIHLVPEKLEFLLKIDRDVRTIQTVLSALNTEKINQLSIEELKKLISEADPVTQSNDVPRKSSEKRTER